MRFKDFLAEESALQTLIEGVPKILQHVELWIDGNEESIQRKMHDLEQLVIYAGGPRKFAMIARRVPAIRHFLKKHKNRLTGSLAEVELHIL